MANIDSGITGTLKSANDAVTVAVSGAAYATVLFSVVGTAGTATATTEVSVDGGTNWIPSAYAKLRSTVSANPTVQAYSGSTPATGETWEVPLPGNCTSFRVRCATAGTATTLSVTGGAPYVPGVPVLATLYDVTEGGIGAGLLTSTTAQDVSGWNGLVVTGVSPTTQVVNVRHLDDAGAIIGGTNLAFVANTSATVMLARNTSSVNFNNPTTGGLSTAPLMGRRIAWYIPAGGTVSTGRIRVEAFR